MSATTDVRDGARTKMARKTTAEEDAIIAAYRDWNGTPPIDQFARSNGISKPALYALLRRRSEPTKTEAAFQGGSDSDRKGEMADWIIDRVAQQALQQILEENRTVHRLEDRVEVLELALREAGIDPDSV